ncbi:sensor domain-containing diguanylate cyclase [Erwiniaceae bacterium BAC15a-03b]|uniref:diguanylate cyclase n=1 Tax=Winslowiella arboricola TaxID=2978220 RepID=A0A9J6PSG8_9GAMM|nr:sensor domain-containing diguanylate cyclase [Winslowiella arboricola]MCU5774076.1 sensor domain-containing diguanylate cyclase [Winslowiella arboricola]MCU5776991.1 sensor domain-containing diguanylate cyclase [Winslowiella arboricola]
MTENLIERISDALGTEKTLEGFVRQMLEMLELVTNMESTYLTRIDLADAKQHILFSRNSQQMQIPEGLAVPWEDTLCKRALDAGQPFTCDVASIWGDSQAAKALGITTYLSKPVMLGDGALYGTLCAASSESRMLSEQAEQVLHLFAELIAQYIRKEQLLEQLQEANVALKAVSFTDELTTLPNRRAVFDQLPRLFARAQRDARYVLIAFIDLDGFKQINDRYGHDTGDAFLRAVSQRLQQSARTDEVLGRLGGDEFIVAGVGPEGEAAAIDAAQTFRSRLAALLIGQYHPGNCLIDYAGASIGVIAVNPAASTPDLAVRAADAAMYEDKKQRKQQMLLQPEKI